MRQRAAQLIGIALGCFIVLAAPFAVYQLITLFVDASSNVKLGVLTASVSVIALLYNNARQQTRDISSRHFSEKRAAYQQIFDFLFDSMKDTDSIDASAENVEKMRTITKSVMVWGSADTINSYNEFLRFSSTNAISEGGGELPLELFSRMENLLKSMRNDLGHSDSKLNKFSLVKLFIKGDEHYKF
jgi:hypothetical protein